MDCVVRTSTTIILKLLTSQDTIIYINNTQWTFCSKTEISGFIPTCAGVGGGGEESSTLTSIQEMTALMDGIETLTLV